MKKLMPICLSVIAMTLLQSCSIQPEALPTNSKKPNIVFIVVDDLGWGDVGYNGSKWVETPNIDQLAKGGKVFNNAYMYPTCSPSRAALASGKQSFKTQVYTVPVLEKGDAKNSVFSKWTVAKKHRFYSEPLSEAGYQMIHLGKWHLVGPNPEIETTYPFTQRLTQPDSGNTEWIAGHQSGKYVDFYPEGRGYKKNVGGTWWGDPARGYALGYKSYSGGYHAPFKNPFIQEKPSDEWLTDRLTNEAIDFIENNKDEPFFVNLHYYTVHRPSIARSPELLKKYQDKPKEALTGKHAKSAREAAGFATLLENMDDNVGRLVKYLDESGLREDTLIIFTSDNGMHKGQSFDKRLRGSKGEIYEGGVKVPAVFNWPKQYVPGSVDTPITLLDYFPTFLDIAKITEEPTDDLDGRSILPMLLDEEYEDRPVFWHIASEYRHGPVSAVRTGDWKLIQFLNTGKLELYNLANDPVEAVNAATTHPDVAEKLVAMLTEWRTINQAPLPPASLLLH